jgi:cation transport regulator ChaB
MPYSSIAELPEAVQKRYSARCQRVFMRAFNATDGDEATRFKFAHTAAGNCTDSDKADSLGKEASMSTPAKASANTFRAQLEKALKSVLGPSLYIADYDPDEGWVVFERYGENVQSGKFKLSFDVGAGDAITFGSEQPTQVVEQITYVAASSGSQRGYADPAVATAKAGALITAGVAPMQPMKAAELEPDEMEEWFAGKAARRLLVIPFGGPIPSPDGKGRDMDVEYFDERTDIKPDWFDARPMDWHHSQDPSGLMNGVLIGKADRLGTEDGTIGEPDEYGWWADAWLKAGERRLAAVKALVARGAQLFGSSYAYPNLVRRGKAGHIDVWPYMLQTLSTSPQNTLSTFRPAKAVLEAFDQADIAISDRVLRRMLAALDDLRDLPATAANGRLDPARDLLDRAAKAGREPSGRHLTETDEWRALLDSIASQTRSFRDQVRATHSPESTQGDH